jgi:hypothetical protein
VGRPQPADNVSGLPEGTTLTVDLEIDGQPSMALNGSPQLSH